MAIMLVILLVDPRMCTVRVHIEFGSYSGAVDPGLMTPRRCLGVGIAVMDRPAIAASRC